MMMIIYYDCQGKLSVWVLHSELDIPTRVDF
jgi:hypothetical protein